MQEKKFFSVGAPFLPRLNRGPGSGQAWCDIIAAKPLLRGEISISCRSAIPLLCSRQALSKLEGLIAMIEGNVRLYVDTLQLDAGFFIRDGYFFDFTSSSIISTWMLLSFFSSSTNSFTASYRFFAITWCFIGRFNLSRGISRTSTSFKILNLSPS